jgi:hypothetical protein
MPYWNALLFALLARMLYRLHYCTEIWYALLDCFIVISAMPKIGMPYCNALPYALPYLNKVCFTVPKRYALLYSNMEFSSVPKNGMLYCTQKWNDLVYPNMVCFIVLKNGML